MAIRLGDAIVYFKGDKTALDQAQQDSERSTKSWVSRLGGAISGGLTVAASAAGVAITGALVGAGKLAWDAMPIEGIASAFYSMADGAKLAELRVGSLNTVTDADLMQSYNRAALLVSQSFAEELPNAMGYFGKISAATGDDIGYLMNSYVTGIGRLSPMILDNLSIQVDMNKAYEDYAAKIGVATDELTKEQQQMALSEQVLGLLAERTEGMGDISENAATKAAQLQAAFGNMKDQVGTALLPALTALLTPLAALAQEYGPQVVAWAEVAGKWLAENLPVAITKLQSVWQTVFPVIQATVETWWPVIKSIFERVSGWLSSEGPGALQGLQAAWQTVWGVIQTVLEVVGQFIQERLAVIQAWWQEHGDSVMVIVNAALGAIQTIIMTVLGLIQTFWALWGDEIISMLGVMWDTLTTIVDAGMQAIGLIIDLIAAAIQGDWETFGETISNLWALAWETIETIVDNGKKNVMTFIDGLIEAVTGAFDIDWGELGQKIIDGIVSALSNGASAVADAARGAAQAALDAAKGFLGIESPSKAFMRLGEQSMEGMVAGIMERTGQVTAAARQAMGTALQGAEQVDQSDRRSYEFHTHANYRDQDEVSMVDDLRFMALQFGGA
jgi:hypothetical protein